MKHGRRVAVVGALVVVVGLGLFDAGHWAKAMNDFVRNPSTSTASSSAVRRGLWLDFGFIAVYLAAAAGACIGPTARLVRYRSVGRRLAGLAYAAAAADVLENVEAFRVLGGDSDAARWLRYATAAKWGLIAVPAGFGFVALVAWAMGRTERSLPRAAAVADALSWARRQDPPVPESPARRLTRWSRGDRPSDPVVAPPARAVPHDLTGICFSGGGIRSAAYNLGALQELQASGELGRADLLTAVSGGSYIASAHAIAGAFSEADALGTIPPFAPGSLEEEYLRNRTTYLFPGVVGTGYALWRLVRGLAVNVGFVVVVLFVFARPYGWLVEPHLQFGCVVAQGAPVTSTTTTVGGRPAASPAPCVAPPPGAETKRQVTFRHFGWAVWPLAAAAGLAVVLGLIDLLIRPKETPALRLESWSFRLLGVAAVGGVLLYLLPSLAARLFSDRTFHDGALDRLPAVTAIGGAVSSLLTMVGVLRRSGPKPPAGEAAESPMLGVGKVARKLKSGAASAGTGLLRLQMTLVGGLVGPVGLGAAFLALAMGSMIRPGLDPAQVKYWLLCIAVLVLVQGIGDANRWCLQPYYKRRLSTAFVLRRRCDPVLGPLAEEVPFDQPIALTRLIDTPRLVVCAAANLTTYGLLPPGRPVSTFTFSRETVDAGILGTVPTAKLATMLGHHYARDFTVPAAMAASGAAVSPEMGKMTKPAYRFLLALTNVRLGVWLPNPARVVAWAKDQPDPAVLATDEPDVATVAQVQLADAAAQLRQALAAEAALAADPPADGPDGAATVQAARMHTERCRRELERADAAASADVVDFDGYPWLPRPSLLFRELFGLYGSKSRFVYVTDGGHYENLGLVELIRRGCEHIYCFDAAGDRIDRFTTVADAVSIARTELGVRITIDPTPMAPAHGSEFNALDCVVGTFCYPGHDDTPGTIVFAKLGVVADVPADVRSWRETHPTFPTDGTADQLYTDQRFEAYRALGAGTAVRAVAAMRQARSDARPASAGPLRRGETGCAPPSS